MNSFKIKGSLYRLSLLQLCPLFSLNTKVQGDWHCTSWNLQKVYTNKVTYIFTVWRCRTPENVIIFWNVDFDSRNFSCCSRFTLFKHTTFTYNTMNLRSLFNIPKSPIADISVYKWKCKYQGKNKHVFTYPYLQTRQSPHNQSIPKLQ